MNPRKSTSSFSKRENTRRNPFNRRNNRSISFRLWYISGHTPRGVHGCSGVGTTGMNPKARASWRVSLPSYARSIRNGPGRCGPRRVSSLRPSGASWASRRERERYGGSSIRGHMNLGVQPRDLPIDWGRFF